ncbi:hypothetical protein ACGFYP_26360 [Streptomyces sp. NPDC048370]|uniref:hypothetical protein n=1 Tax=Streptomyces sp. NPDC048370 TaxID=3365540 RepID=UPI003711B932
MSRETGRETDSSSSGAQGRGGAAYPSGTPPYGSRQYPSLHPTQDGSDETAGAAGAPPAPPQPEEPKTETTLTTRIRINIPGSRPIPPVVVRKPVGDSAADSAPAPAPEAPAPAPAPEPPAAPEPAQAEPPKAEDKPTSDWFAPRKPATPEAPAAPAPSAPPAAPAAKSGLSQLSEPGPGPAAGPGGARPGASGPGRTPPQGVRPPATGATRGSGFAGPATGGIPRVGGASISATPASGTPMFLSTPPQDEAAYGPDGDPYAQGAPQGPGPGAPTRPNGPNGPNGPTTGPMTGNSTLGTGPMGGGTMGGGTMGGGTMGGGPVAGNPLAGLGPMAGNPLAVGDPFGGTPRMSDDTAVLTPQGPGPGSPAAPGQPQPPGGHVSGDTLTSGIPVVPSGPDLTPRLPDRGFSTPEYVGGAPAEPRPAPSSPAPAASPARSSAPQKKGRSKLVLVGAGVFGLAGVAYGAGLLLNHSDVPKGTTVLGVDIGGGTKEEGVNKLETALGKRAHAPLKLSVGGKTVELSPDKAGLALDSQETVRAAAGSDYNPVSVIGSLFGGERVAQPKLPVDEEKLAVALRDVAGVSGSATEGTITFAPNKVTAVEGKPGKGLDVGRSMIFVKDAFRAQVETGKAKTVELPVVTRQPSITKAELDRAMKEFARPAMSDAIVIKAGAKEIKFGPARSLPQILSMKAVNGRLVEVYDKKAIDRLLDGVFDGVMITKADGKKHQVSADDVAFVMRDALLGKTTAERTKTIDLTGQG